MYYVQRADGHRQGLPTTDYLSLIRRFDWGTMLEECRGYISSYRNMCIFSSEFGMNAHLTATGLQHLLTWAVCGHQPENIESLYIYARDAPQYTPVMARWTSLQSVVLDATTYRSHSIDERTLSNLTSAHEFLTNLQVHRGPRSLQSITLLHGRSPESLPASCKNIRQEIMRHMAPLHRPREITPENWDQFSAWAGEIDCGNVRHVCLMDSTNWDAIYRWWPDFSLQTLFQQCRRLSSIDSYVKDANYFQWAIAEKTACKSKQRSGSEEGGNDAFGYGVNGNSSDVSRHVDGHTLRPFPLREVTLKISNSVWDAVVADLFHAFDNTLEHAILYAINDGPETSQHIGLLECSRLRYLQIQTPHELSLAPDALVRCPQIEHIELFDPMSLFQYTHDQVRRWDVCQWPCLQVLRLTGSPAIEFHPATLHKCQALQKLSLRNMFSKSASEFYPNISSEAREQVGKLWTWDWRLPYLTELNLMGEFAEWFEIKTLASLPKLQTLKLELLQRKRKSLDLPKAWRWTPSSPISDESDTSRNNEDATSSEGGYKDYRYVASTLTEVTFMGRWHILDDTLEALLLDVLPNLQTLNITECYGFTTACFVESLRRHPSIVSSTSSRQLTKADIKMMGLTTTEPSSTPISQQQARSSPTLDFKGGRLFFLK
ncbi:hypothetical protein BGW41_002336 [Actinomortierella wolfii]|nr:hypothetical protein BGW41_002336 [Actinomortierella wolfii]